jgi:hypothetical protein
MFHKSCSKIAISNEKEMIEKKRFFWDPTIESCFRLQGEFLKKCLMVKISQKNLSHKLQDYNL